MKDDDKLIRTVQLVILALVILSVVAMVVPRYVYAGGDCKGHSCNNDTDVTTQVSTDVSTHANTNVDASSDVHTTFSSKSRSLGLANGTGDVDMGVCYGSKGDSTPIYARQRYKILPLQCANHLDSIGLHEAAARMRCSDKDYGKLFSDRDECLALSQAMRSPSTAPVAEPSEDDDDYHQEHEEELAMLRADIEAKIQNLEAAQAAPVPAQRTIIQQQPYLSDDQKTALRELVK